MAQPEPSPAAEPVTASQWLVLALTEHLAATQDGERVERQEHLEAARAAYQRVLDLCDPHSLPAAVRGLDALARHEAAQAAAEAPGAAGALELTGHLAALPPARAQLRGGGAPGGELPVLN